MLDKLTVADFERHLGAVFPASLPGGELVELRLIEARPIRPTGVGVGGGGGGVDRGGGREPFSLVFLGPDRPALGQRTHALGHPELGTLDIFLVPIGPAKDHSGSRYQVIFA